MILRITITPAIRRRLEQRQTWRYLVRNLQHPEAGPVFRRAVWHSLVELKQARARRRAGKGARVCKRG